MNYIFENDHETLFETTLQNLQILESWNEFDEMKWYLYRFPLEHDTLEYSDMYESMNYIIIRFYGYTLMIKKAVTNEH